MVPRVTVLRVLRECGVDVVERGGEEVSLAKGSTFETQVLPKNVSKRMLHYLHRRYDVPIHYFFNPVMMDFDLIRGPKKKAGAN